MTRQRKKPNAAGRIIVRTLSPEPESKHGFWALLKTKLQGHDRYNDFDPMSVNRLFDGTAIGHVNFPEPLRFHNGKRLVRCNSAPAAGYVRSDKDLRTSTYWWINPCCAGHYSEYDTRFNNNFSYEHCQSLWERENARELCHRHHWEYWEDQQQIGTTFAGRWGTPWSMSTTSGLQSNGISYETAPYVKWNPRKGLPDAELQIIKRDAERYRESDYVMVTLRSQRYGAYQMLKKEAMGRGFP